MARRRPKKDNRKFRRVTLRILVDYQAKGGVHCDYATTLGAGGMFLQTDLPLERNDSVKVRFRVPRGETLHELEAMVTWAQPTHEDIAGNPSIAGVGLQFTSAGAKEALAKELENYANL
jgi:uncharacterized protein (TIGR02266 family)